MPRKKLSPESLQSCIKGDLIPDVVTAYENCSFFIDEYEFSAGAINNLMSAKKHLQKAFDLTKAAEVIIDFEVIDS